MDNLWGDLTKKFVQTGNATVVAFSTLVFPLLAWLGLQFVMENPDAWSVWGIKSWVLWVWAGRRRDFKFKFRCTVRSTENHDNQFSIPPAKMKHWKRLSYKHETLKGLVDWAFEISVLNTISCCFMTQGMHYKGKLHPIID